ncbi:HNH endonuclease [Cellulosilyticum sp. ST5]|uniref:HNH endonuclease n=1 Tax=Cellulosilyticum sp. ST5 TaxID=3055805 RepID=UPI00397742ED
MLEKLEKEFHKDMVNIYSEADKQLGYKASHFKRMLSEQGGYKTAIKLVNQPKATDGFTTLWEYKRLDLSVEALVCRDKYRCLFDETIRQTCMNRLKDYGYNPVTSINKELELIEEIRILPMSQEEFDYIDIEGLQDTYFMGDLINHQDGTYHYRKVGIKAEKNVLFLFQYKNHIVASAVLYDTEKYDTPIDGEYYGAWKFDKDTIQVFKPITLSEIQAIDDSVQGFSQAKKIIDISYLEKIIELIEEKKRPDIPEEISLMESKGLKEGAKTQIVVNAYERNSIAREKCIAHYKTKDNGKVKCQVCGFCFEDFYGEEFKDKIHVHHIKPLAEIDDEYEVDPIKDLIPICPNCHYAIHSSKENDIFQLIKCKLGTAQ